MALFPKVWRLSFGSGMNHICAEKQTFVNAHSSPAQSHVQRPLLDRKVWRRLANTSTLPFSGGLLYRRYSTMNRSPYNGSSRKLVLAFDIGTTYSGAAYAFLDPGEVPEIHSVTKRVLLVFYCHTTLINWGADTLTTHKLVPRKSLPSCTTTKTATFRELRTEQGLTKTKVFFRCDGPSSKNITTWHRSWQPQVEAHAWTRGATQSTDEPDEHKPPERKNDRRRLLRFHALSL